MLEFIDEFKKKDDDVKVERFDVSKNIVFNPNAFKEILYHIDKYSDQEIYETIKNSYHLIFTDRFIAEDPNHLALVTNHRFLTIAIRVLSSAELERNIILYCNKLVYDYIHTYVADEYADTRNIFYSLARVVNKKAIQSLLVIGLPEDVATNLLIARYSANNESVNIVRLNREMELVESDIMTIQMCVNIFEKLFDELGLLFQMVMFTPPLTVSIPTTYDNIGLAILYMVNNMPSIGIRKVLTGYTTAYESGMFKQQFKSNGQVVSTGKTYTRYNLETLDYRFARIVGMVASLKEEQIYVP